MIWLCAKMNGREGWPTHEQILFTICDCVEIALPLFEEANSGDCRPRTAIEVARKWVNKKATIDKVKAARHSAWRAYSAAAGYGSVAYAASWAAAYAEYPIADHAPASLCRNAECADICRAKLFVPTAND